MKEFYPDLQYNKSKRNKYITLLLLSVFFVGGMSAVMIFVLKNLMIGLIMLAVLLLVLLTIPSAFTNYPTKNKPLIEVGETKVRLYSKEEYHVSDVLEASVFIDVPSVKGTKEAKFEYLKKIAAKKPEQPVTGACDVLVKTQKGKEETKYNIVSDCLGALQALLDAGVKRYRIIYAMGKLTVKAIYRVARTGEQEEGSLEMTENEKMMQLI